MWCIDPECVAADVPDADALKLCGPGYSIRVRRTRVERISRVIAQFIADKTTEFPVDLYVAPESVAGIERVLVTGFLEDDSPTRVADLVRVADYLQIDHMLDAASHMLRCVILDTISTENAFVRDRGPMCMWDFDVRLISSRLLERVFPSFRSGDAALELLRLWAPMLLEYTPDDTAIEMIRRIDHRYVKKANLKRAAETMNPKLYSNIPFLLYRPVDSASTIAM